MSKEIEESLKIIRAEQEKVLADLEKLVAEERREYLEDLERIADNSLIIFERVRNEQTIEIQNTETNEKL